MNNLKEQIVDKIVEPNENRKFNSTKAIVINYDNISNRASIKFQEPKGEGIFKLDNVPVQIGGRGLHSVALESGSEVWVTFMNGSPFLAKIVGLADENYQNNSREELFHIEEGALIPKISENEENNYNYIYKDIIDTNNTDIIKYSGFDNFDVLQTFSEFLNKLGYYNDHEIGLTNPYNHSTIKVREDGTIDIYTENNIGFSINPTTSTVSITAENVDINSLSFKLNTKDLSIDS